VHAAHEREFGGRDTQYFNEPEVTATVLGHLVRVGQSYRTRRRNTTGRRGHPFCATVEPVVGFSGEGLANRYVFG